MRFAAWAVVLAIGALRPEMHADVRGCFCDLANPEAAQLRACSLCVEAAKHPPTEHVILLRDNDPAKPNRWLAVPRAAYDGSNPLARMSEAERIELWNTCLLYTSPSPRD